ncbi:integrase_H2C2 domain-containing protein [Trichonephila clavipes]|nr:integrase_H2C2 domain-containing protein [Trichonephila clavipes]
MDKKGPFSSQALCEKSSQCNSTSNRGELLKHVQSQENPADIITRGIDPDKIQDSVLWWYGPSGLQSNPVVSTCDVSEINDNDLYLREFKKIRSSVSCNTKCGITPNHQ